MMKINRSTIIARLLCLALLAFGLDMTANAQLKQFTLEDLNFGGTNYKNMIPKSRTYIWWGNELVRADKETCYQVNKATGKEKVLFTLANLNKWLGATKDNEVASLQRVTFPYADKPVVKVARQNVLLLVDFKAHKVLWQHDATGEDVVDFQPVSKAVAYVKDNNLYVADEQGHATQLTKDGSHDIVYGQAVHRNEFGIMGGTFWSPNGKQLAFYRMDQSMVTDYPLVNTATRTAVLEPTKYPMAGEASHKVTVGVYDMKTGATAYLKAGDPTDRYFTNIAWSPDCKTIYMQELNRDQTDMALVSYDAATGEKLATLYTEHNDKYVEPLHPIQFLPWDASKFILQSQKDGYNHLYLLNTKGEQLKQITTGKWVVMEVLGFDAQHEEIIYQSNECNPIQQNIFLVDVNTGKRALMDDNGAGWHNGQLSQNGQYIIDNYQTPTVPRNIALVSTANGKRTPLFKADDPWKGYAVPEYSCGTIKAADGITDLYYRMVKPVNFDPQKKYPTVVYVYGGPHAHNVDARWHYCSRSWETYMAQKGYLLFILDNRGSENRGRDFEQVTFRHLGVEEMKDQIKGVEFLKTLPYVDAGRLGVHGWSFGGFMTISLLTTYPDVFKVGVAGGPVIDWKYYEVMYGERYMDTPQTNPEGYAETSLINKAKNLKGKLQVIIGTDDPTVVPQNAEAFLRECIKVGTQPDFFVYPGEGHNMMGHQSVHLHERITQYFEDYLK